jgi:hypothetical protein
MKVLVVIAALGAICGLVAGIGGAVVGSSTTAVFGFLSFVVCSGLGILLRYRLKRNHVPEAGS